MIILDTSAVVEILRETQNVKRIKELCSGQEPSITSFTVYELLTNVREGEIGDITKFLSLVKVYNFDSISAFQSAEIDKSLTFKGKKIQKSDLFIAGICFANNAKLITLDKDFLEIAGLDLEMV